MAIPKKIIKYLEETKTKYQPIEHRTVYTAFDKAQTLKVPQKIIGKTLVVKIDPPSLKLRRASKDFTLVLIPANKNLDKVKFKKAVNGWRKKIGQKAAKKISFATENWMKKNLKEVKVGVVPPFGTLWKLPTFVDKTLLKTPKIIVNAGDYNWSIKIKGADLKKLIPGLVEGNFSKTKK